MVDLASNALFYIMIKLREKIKALLRSLATSKRVLKRDCSDEEFNCLILAVVCFIAFMSIWFVLILHHPSGSKSLQLIYELYLKCPEYLQILKACDGIDKTDAPIII